MIPGAVVQARAGSRRLPGKVLADVAGAPLLVRVVERVRRARSLGRVVVATTHEPEDAAVAALCAEHGIPCFRGARDDVLTRVVDAALAFGLDPVVRVTADCPFVCPETIDALVDGLLKQDADYATFDAATVHEGIDPFRLEWLVRVSALSLSPEEREHLALPVRARRAGVRIAWLSAPEGLAARPGLRLSVDEPADLAFARALLARLPREFSVRDLLALVDAEPALLAATREIARAVPHGVHS